MPSNGVRSLFKEISRSGVICTSVDKVNLRIAFRSPGCRMDVVPTEVTTKSKRVFDGDVCKVLVAERYNFLLGDKECEFVLSSISQLGQLDAMDFSADICGNVGNCSIL